ncbi:unnamed protein product [Arabidopsis arenosa]|uniref:Cytochrome b561 domain-containing protein n=1 Tax=Arabidopsis arenosa TaxID=38785 RepID=A0A8S2AHY8_ARAAE|nr:unnamed protein product [Arabidopsis arenosa]
MSLSSRVTLVVLCCLFVLIPSFTIATTEQGLHARCKSYSFNNGKSFRSCTDLSVLNSYLHFNYTQETGVLEIAYRHSNLESSSWIAWAINPTTTLLCFKESPLSFLVMQVSAEYFNGEMMIFATLVLPPNTTVVNNLWQDGPSKEGDRLGMHAMSGDHLKSMASLDLLSGQVTTTKSVNGNMLLVKRIHGIVNAISWGILMPIGVMAARYMKNYEILALKARLDKNHKYRKYWNWYHHTVGYIVIVLSIYNIYKGLSILQPGSGWKIAYTTIICCIAAFAIVMEILQFKKRCAGLFCKKTKALEADHHTTSVDVICNHHKVGGGVDRRDGKGGREKASSGFEIQIENYNLTKNFMIPSVFVVSYPHTFSAASSLSSLPPSAANPSSCIAATAA